MVKGSKHSPKNLANMRAGHSPNGMCKRGHPRRPETTAKGGWCKVCKAEMGRLWREKNYEHWAKKSKQSQVIYRSKHAIRIAKRERDLKLEVLAHYGLGGRHQCCWPDCGIEDIDVLTLDHINNDGAKDRKQGVRKTGKSWYRNLRKRGYPEGYQTLCANHQLKKEILHSQGRDQ